MRCDVNISVNKTGEKLGTRSEIKNMNSLSFIEKAIAYEYSRHVSAIQNGEMLYQETRRFNESDGSTSAMREKENAQDYRYYDDPDIPTIIIEESFIESIKRSLPELPIDIRNRYLNIGLSVSEADLLIKYKKVADYFSEAIKTGDPKILSNYILGEIFRLLETEAKKEIFDILVSPVQLSSLSNAQKSGKINAQLAKKALSEMLKSGKSWETFISESDLQEISDNELISYCKEAIEKNSNALSDYLSGKEKALKAILGYVMKKTKGKVNPEKTEKLLIELITKKG